MSTASWVTLVTLVAGSICFIFYCWSSIIALTTKSAAQATAAQAKAVTTPDAKAVSIDDFTKLLDALGKLTDSLSKASPSLVSLIGAILLYSVAAAASGAFAGGPTADNQKVVTSKPSSAGKGSASGNNQEADPANASAPH